MTPNEIAAARARCEAATAGPWGADTIHSEGSYGRGDEVYEGFNSYKIETASGRTIADALNADLSEIHEDYDEDGGSAWDEIARCNFKFIAHARSDLPAALDEIEKLQKKAAHWRQLFMESSGDYDAMSDRAEAAEALSARQAREIEELTAWKASAMQVMSRHLCDCGTCPLGKTLGSERCSATELLGEIARLTQDRDGIKSDYLRRHKDACDRWLQIRDMREIMKSCLLVISTVEEDGNWSANFVKDMRFCLDGLRLALAAGTGEG